MNGRTTVSFGAARFCGYPECALRAISKLGRDLAAVLGALAFLGIGFGAIYLVVKVADVKDGAVLASLLIIPALVYLVLSGRVTELKGPGGLEVKLKEAANESVTSRPQQLQLDGPPVAEMQEVVKGDPMKLKQRLTELDESQPIVLTLVVSDDSQYSTWSVQQYAKALSQFRSFRFVVFIDKEKCLVGYMPVRSFRELLGVGQLGAEFIQLVNEGKSKELLRFPGVLTKTISPDQTAADALRQMEDVGTDALLVSDQKKAILGVVERDELLSRLVLALVR
jgi:hypothetical protein